MNTKHKLVPIDVLEKLCKAIRKAERDARDQVLKDTTRKLLIEANDALTDWKDAVADGRATSQ